MSAVGKCPTLDRLSAVRTPWHPSTPPPAPRTGDGRHPDLR